MIDLSGQVALVTGGSRGIGAACCRLLAQAGAKVVVAYHANQQAATTVVDAIHQTGGQAVALAADLREETPTRQLFEQAHDHWGRLDIVVVNAGIWKRGSIDTMTAAQWRDTMSANLDSAFFTCQAAAKRMVAQGSGKLITIASTAGQRGEAHYSHYAASKGALISMTRSLAAELGPSGVHVNCVAPGWVLTNMTTDVFADETRKQTIEAEIPLRRIATAEDIAGPVLFLASELSRHVQGAVINVNGGSVLC